MHTIHRKPKTFYRIEKDGLGHFRSSRNDLPFWGKHSSMPTILDELSQVYSRNVSRFFDFDFMFNWFCAYKSVKDLMDFNDPESLAVLHNEGFRIHKITAKYTIECEKQILFRQSMITGRTV